MSGPSIQSFCLETGERFITPLTGSYSDHTDLLPLLRKAWSEVTNGAALQMSPSTPAHLEAEALDAMIQFEINPPCGCKSHCGGAS